ncbi:MAG TPA: hypothetical protein VIL45_07030 [Thermoplasmata archaeon]
MNLDISPTAHDLLRSIRQRIDPRALVVARSVDDHERMKTVRYWTLDIGGIWKILAPAHRCAGRRVERALSKFLRDAEETRP